MEGDRILRHLGRPTLRGEYKRRPWTLPLVITEACDQKAVFEQVVTWSDPQTGADAPGAVEPGSRRRGEDPTPRCCTPPRKTRPRQLRNCRPEFWRSKHFPPLLSPLSQIVRKTGAEDEWSDGAARPDRLTGCTSDRASPPVPSPCEPRLTRLAAGRSRVGRAARRGGSARLRAGRPSWVSRRPRYSAALRAFIAFGAQWARLPQRPGEASARPLMTGPGRPGRRRG